MIMINLFLILAIINIVSGAVCEDTSCDQCLSNVDFESGTYIISAAGKYCLSEDIIFNPNEQFPTDDATYPGCDTLSNGGYALGWFAAISVACDDVEIDLKKYSISMGRHLFIQQRFFSIIEIGKTPFITNQGPANFGTNTHINNVYIHDGELGLSSHHGIHANDATNVVIENLHISQFEVGGIQINGFDGVEMRNLIIGPSVDDLPVCSYYSNARFMSYAFELMIQSMGDDVADTTTVTFNGGRSLSIAQIYANLVESMDIFYRYVFDETTDDDANSPLFAVSIDLYSNPAMLPDGSALYGVVLHSHGVAINGYGQAPNDEDMGENVVMENVKIQDLKLNANEMPAVYFDECDGDGATKNHLLGPFGDVMDIRRMVGSFDNAQMIDLGDDFTGLSYVGNPVSDAQIALSLYGEQYGDTDYGSRTNAHFLSWALDEYNDISYDGLPSCTSFICGGDAMFHANKGVHGVRMDLIENVKMNNIIIKRLINKSPLSSYACSNYSGSHNGGSPFQSDDEGGMSTDVKGIAITGGDVIFDGYNNVIEKLISYYGDIVGLYLRDNADISFDYVYKDDVIIEPNMDTDTEDDRAYLHIKELCPGHQITFALLAELLVDKKYPYPNNFYACNIKIESDQVTMTPYPPNGIDTVFCADYVPNDIDDIISNILPVDVQTYDDDNKVAQGIDHMKPEEQQDAHSSVMIDDNNNYHPPLNIKPNDNLIYHPLSYNNNQSPYMYFIFGVFCIIIVVLAIFTFILKCGQYMIEEKNTKKQKNQNKRIYDQVMRNNKLRDSEDSDSSTEDEQP